MATSKKNHQLLAKSEIAKALGLSSQTFANKQARDPKFPAPTYSNRSGSVALYTPEDAKKVYDYCTKAERERLDRAAAMFTTLTETGDLQGFEDVELPEPDEEGTPAALEETPAKEEKPAPAPAKAEAPTQTKEEKLAADKAAHGITDPTPEEKAKKEAEVAAKIKAADEARKESEAKRLDKNESARIAAADNKSGLAPKTAPAKAAAPKTAPASAQAQAPVTAKVGTGAAFGIKQK